MLDKVGNYVLANLGSWTRQGLAMAATATGITALGTGSVSEGIVAVVVFVANLVWTHFHNADTVATASK